MDCLFDVVEFGLRIEHIPGWYKEHRSCRQIFGARLFYDIAYAPFALISLGRKGLGLSADADGKKYVRGLFSSIDDPEIAALVCLVVAEEILELALFFQRSYAAVGAHTLRNREGFPAFLSPAPQDFPPIFCLHSFPESMLADALGV